MAFKFLQQRAEERRREYMAHVRPELEAVFNRGETITKVEWDRLCEEHGMNSYERHLLLPLVDDTVLLDCVDYALRNASVRGYYQYGALPSTYDEALIGVYLPMLVKRFQERTTRVAEV